MDTIKIKWLDGEVEAQRIGVFAVHGCCGRSFLLRHQKSGIIICGLTHELALAGADTFSIYSEQHDGELVNNERNRRILSWVNEARDLVEEGEDYPSYRDWHISMYGERPRTDLADTGFSNPLDLVPFVVNRDELN